MTLLDSPPSGASPDPGDEPPATSAVIAPVAAAPSRTDPTAARATRLLGGPFGRHAGRWSWSWWTPVRVLLLMTCVTLLLGFGQKSPCATGQWESGTAPVRDLQYTHVCYSDVVPLWGAERLDVGAVPYRDTKVEYPVLTGAFMWFTAELTHGLLSLAPDWQDVVVFGALTSVLLALCGLVVTGLTAQTTRRRPYDAAIFALSPLLIVHAYSNWDLLAMALAAAGLWAWSRQKPVLAGVMIGLGVAAKLYPVFLLVPLVILAVRTRRWRSSAWCIVSAGVAWATVNVPVALAYHAGWWEFYKFSIDRSAERSSVWAIGRTWDVYGTVFYGGVDAPNWVPPGWAVALALILALGVVALIGFAAPVKPRIGQLAFLCVLAFLLTTKVWSPQYSLWLVPLLALARPRWRSAIIWQVTEIAVWFLTLFELHGIDELYEPSIGQNAHGIAYGWLVLVLVVRDAILLTIAGLIVREMWRPELDVVRSGGVDDPAGGEFDEAPDYLARPAGRGRRGGAHTGRAVPTQLASAARR